MADDPKKDEAEVEEKPKRRLRRTKAKDDAPKTEAGAEETTDEAEVEADVEVAEEPKAEAEEKPKAEKKSKAKAKGMTLHSALRSAILDWAKRTP